MSLFLHTIGDFLNQSLLSDPRASYLAVTAARVVAIGFLLMAFIRIYGALRQLPHRGEGEPLREYFSAPWWRIPTIIISTGLLGSAAVFALQAATGNTQPIGSGLNALTPYLLLIYLFSCMTSHGIALAAGHLKTSLKNGVRH